MLNRIGPYLFFALLVIIPVKVSCQKYYGYIINLNQDTIQCRILFGGSNFDVPTQTILFDQNFVKVEIDGEMIKYQVHEISGFAIYVFKSWHKYFSLEVSPQKRKFMKLIADGSISLFYRETYNMLTRLWEHYFYLRKNDTHNVLYLKSGLMNNKEKLLEFLNDCPELKLRLDNKVYRLGDGRDWEPMIVYYNENC